MSSDYLVSMSRRLVGRAAAPNLAATKVNKLMKVTEVIEVTKVIERGAGKKV